MKADEIITVKHKYDLENIETIARCFKKSAIDGYNSFEFLNNFVDSEYGRKILLHNGIKDYYFWGYMYEGLLEEFKLTKGNALDEYVMYSYGYLLKYWLDIHKVEPRLIVKILPLERFNAKFGFYHTQGDEYIIENETERYYRNN